uniref:VOC domain-containing protein n=1 Tax=Tanacetum cinerariifolium TaxID=118510 RepID=A0A699GMG2_TANCI|nr:hypothetical protein [Tanacetum cinerariifolium]
MAFYTQAFDAVETARLTDPNGKIMHASMRIGDSTIMLVDDYPDYGSVGPKALKGSPVTLHLYVEDVDQAYAQAVAAGGVGRTPPADMFWGDRYAMLVDPFGHNWSIATHIRDLTPEEIKDAMARLPDPQQSAGAGAGGVSASQRQRRAAHAPGWRLGPHARPVCAARAGGRHDAGGRRLARGRHRTGALVAAVRRGRRVRNPDAGHGSSLGRPRRPRHAGRASARTPSRPDPLPGAAARRFRRQVRRQLGARCRGPGAHPCVPRRGRAQRRAAGRVRPAGRRPVRARTLRQRQHHRGGRTVFRIERAGGRLLDAAGSVAGRRRGLGPGVPVSARRRPDGGNPRSVRAARAARVHAGNGSCRSAAARRTAGGKHGHRAGQGRGGRRAVEVEHPEDLAVGAAHGRHQFRARIDVAGNVAGECVHIGHDDGFAFHHGGAAHAAAPLDADTGGLALERAQHQLIALQEVKAGPVQVRHGVENKRAEVCGVGDQIGFTVDQARQLRAQVVEHGVFCCGSVGAVGGVAEGKSHGMWCERRSGLYGSASAPPAHGSSYSIGESYGYQQTNRKPVPDGQAPVSASRQASALPHRCAYTVARARTPVGRRFYAVGPADDRRRAGDHRRGGGRQRPLHGRIHRSGVIAGKARQGASTRKQGNSGARVQSALPDRRRRQAATESGHRFLKAVYVCNVIRLIGHGGRAQGRPVLRARPVLHRPVASGGTGRDHARPRRPRARRPPPLPGSHAGRQRAAFAAGPHPYRRPGLWRNGGPQRGRHFPASGRSRAGLGTAPAGRVRRHQRLVARQCRPGPRQHHAVLQLWQGAAHPERSRSRHRPHHLPRRCADPEPGVPRQRRVAAAHGDGGRRREKRYRPGARDRAAVGGRLAVGQALRRLQRRLCQRLDAAARRPPPARRRSRFRAVRSCGLAGLDASHYRHRRRARDRHPRFDRGAGALAAAAGPAGKRLRYRVRRRRGGRRRCRPIRRRQRQRQRQCQRQCQRQRQRHRQRSGRHRGRAGSAPGSRCCSGPGIGAGGRRATGRAADVLQHGGAGRRGVGRVFPGGRQAAPGRAHQAAAPVRHRVFGAGRLAVRRVLPRGRRPGRNHCPHPAAAHPAERNRPGRLDRAGHCAVARRRPRHGAHVAVPVLGPARYARALPADQADRRRLPGGRLAPAGHARAQRHCRPRQQADRPAPDGLDRRQRASHGRRLPAADRGTHGRRARAARRPAVPVLSGAPARTRAGVAGRPVAVAGGMEVRRHARPAGQPRRQNLAVVARRRLDHRALSRAGGAGAARRRDGVGAPAGRVAGRARGVRPAGIRGARPAHHAAVRTARLAGDPGRIAACAPRGAAAAPLASDRGRQLGAAGRDPRPVARARRGRHDAQGGGRRVRRGPHQERGHVVEMEDRAVQRGCGPDLRPGGPRPARLAVHRLHVCRVGQPGRGRSGGRWQRPAQAGAVCQGIFGPHRRRNRQARPAINPALPCASPASCASAPINRWTRPIRSIPSKACWSRHDGAVRCGHQACCGPRAGGRVVCGARLERVSVPAQGLAGSGQGPVRPAAREYRRRQDVCRVAGRAATRAAGAPSARGPESVVDHADAGAGRRHLARLAGVGCRPAAAVADRSPYRRHGIGPARAPEQAPARHAGHHAGKPDAHAQQGRCGGPVRAAGHDHHRRMARADGQQARRANPAGAGAPAPLEPAPAGVGPVGHAGQPGAGARSVDARWRDGRGACEQGNRGRHPDPRPSVALPVGRPPGHPDAAVRGRRNRTARQHAGVYQYPIPGRAVVPAHARRPARLGRPDRAAPRLAGQGSARLGGAGPEKRPAEGRGMHVQPGPGRGFSAGGAGAADRQRQGHRPAAAACRAQRSRAGPGIAPDAGAHTEHGAAGGGRRAPGRSRAQYRSAARAEQAARRAGAAPGDHRPGRRLPFAGTVRRGAHGLVVPRTDGRGMAVGARFRRARRADAGRVSRIPARAAGRRGHLSRARSRHRPPPPHGHRHHRVRLEPASEIRERRAAGQRGGIVHLAPAQGRPFLVCGAHPGIRAAARDDRVRAARHRRARRGAALAGRQDADVVRAGARRARTTAAGHAGPLRRAGNARHRAAAGDPAEMVGAAHARHHGGGNHAQPGRAAPVHVSVRGTVGAHRAGVAAGVARGKGDAGDVFDCHQRLRLRAARAPGTGLGRTARRGPRRPGRAVQHRAPARGCAGQFECDRTVAAALSRDCPHCRPDFPGFPGAAKKRAPVAGVVGAVLFRVPAARRGQPAAHAGAARGAGAGAGTDAPARHAGGTAGAPYQFSCDQACHAVRLCADGRALPRKTQHRKTVGPGGAHGAAAARKSAVLAARADAGDCRHPLRQGGVVPRAGRAGAGRDHVRQPGCAGPPGGPPRRAPDFVPGRFFARQGRACRVHAGGHAALARAASGPAADAGARQPRPARGRSAAVAVDCHGGRTDAHGTVRVLPPSRPGSDRLPDGRPRPSRVPLARRLGVAAVAVLSGRRAAHHAAGIRRFHGRPRGGARAWRAVVRHQRRHRGAGAGQAGVRAAGSGLGWRPGSQKRLAQLPATRSQGITGTRNDPTRVSGRLLFAWPNWCTTLTTAAAKAPPAAAAAGRARAIATTAAAARAGAPGGRNRERDHDGRRRRHGAGADRGRLAHVDRRAAGDRGAGLLHQLLHLAGAGIPVLGGLDAHADQRQVRVVHAFREPAARGRGPQFARLGLVLEQVQRERGLVAGKKPQVAFVVDLLRGQRAAGQQVLGIVRGEHSETDVLDLGGNSLDLVLRIQWHGAPPANGVDMGIAGAYPGLAGGSDFPRERTPSRPGQPRRLAQALAPVALDQLGDLLAGHVFVCHHRHHAQPRLANRSPTYHHAPAGHGAGRAGSAIAHLRAGARRRQAAVAGRSRGVAGRHLAGAGWRARGRMVGRRSVSGHAARRRRRLGAHRPGAGRGRIRKNRPRLDFLAQRCPQGPQHGRGLELVHRYLRRDVPGVLRDRFPDFEVPCGQAAVHLADGGPRTSMKLRYSIALSLPLASAAAMGADLALKIDVPQLNVAEYHRPYIAAWLENADQKVVTNLAVLYDTGKKDNTGTKWLKDMRQWWRKTGRDVAMPLDGVSGATKAPGEIALTFPAAKAALDKLPAGQYTLLVEAAREAGGREVVKVPLQWPPKSAQQVTGQGKEELGARPCAQAVAAAIVHHRGKPRQLGHHRRRHLRRPVRCRPHAAQARRHYHHRPGRRQGGHAKRRQRQAAQQFRPQAAQAGHLQGGAGVAERVCQLQGQGRRHEALPRYGRDFCQGRARRCGRPQGLAYAGASGNVRDHGRAGHGSLQAHRRRPGAGAGDAPERLARRRKSHVAVPARRQTGRQPGGQPDPGRRALSRHAGRDPPVHRRQGRADPDLAGRRHHGHQLVGAAGGRAGARCCSRAARAAAAARSCGGGNEPLGKRFQPRPLQPGRSGQLACLAARLLRRAVVCAGRGARLGRRLRSVRRQPVRAGTGAGAPRVAAGRHRARSVGRGQGLWRGPPRVLPEKPGPAALCRGSGRRVARRRRQARRPAVVGGAGAGGTGTAATGAGAARPGRGHVRRLPPLFRARRPPLRAHHRPAQRHADCQRPGVGHRDPPAMHGRRRLVHRAYRARSGRRAGAGRTPGPGRPLCRTHHRRRRPRHLPRNHEHPFTRHAGRMIWTNDPTRWMLIAATAASYGLPDRQCRRAGRADPGHAAAGRHCRAVDRIVGPARARFAGRRTGAVFGQHLRRRRRARRGRRLCRAPDDHVAAAGAPALRGAGARRQHVSPVLRFRPRAGRVAAGAGRAGIVSAHRRRPQRRRRHRAMAPAAEPPGRHQRRARLERAGLSAVAPGAARAPQSGQRRRPRVPPGIDAAGRFARLGIGRPGAGRGAGRAGPRARIFDRIDPGRRQRAVAGAPAPPRRRQPRRGVGLAHAAGCRGRHHRPAPARAPPLPAGGQCAASFDPDRQRQRHCRPARPPQDPRPHQPPAQLAAVRRAQRRVRHALWRRAAAVAHARRAGKTRPGVLARPGRAALRPAPAGRAGGRAAGVGGRRRGNLRVRQPGRDGGRRRSGAGTGARSRATRSPDCRPALPARRLLSFSVLACGKYATIAHGHTFF